MTAPSSFVRTGARTFLATERTSGAWALDEQHVGPSLGLLVHLVELDRAARGREDLQVARLGFDVLGTMPVGEVSTSVSVVRAGRTVELVEAVLRAAGRDTVRLRAWLLRRGDTAALAGSAHPAVPAPQDVPPFDLTTVWPGGFIAAAQVRREQVEPGRARSWVRTGVPLLDGEPVGRLAAVCGLLDIANGLTVRAAPAEVAFPNVDLTAHLLRAPRGDWVGFDTTVSFGPDGLGVTSSVLHDLDGPFGVQAQTLTVRPV